LYRREEFTAEGFDHVSLVNLNSIAYCALALRPALARSDSAALVIVSSSAAYRTTFGNPAYNASKAGLLGLIRSLAAAWIGDGIRVNGIAPGLVETKLTHVTTRHPERLENALGTIPSRRLGTARDMAGAALYLASPLSDYVVGQTIVVDGGASL
jgi:3-oxoacyl-[acyl-carrier protein] reductase